MVACADFETADLAIRSYLEDVGSMQPDVICLAVAGPVIDKAVRFTNNNWTIDAAELGSDFSGATVSLLNDFEAIAYSIPYLTDRDSLPLGLPESTTVDDQRYAFGIVGPGTGLGYAALYKREGIQVPITGEGGHLGFAPESQVQLDVLTALREKYDRVYYERLVSGPGIENIYWALTKIHGEMHTQLSAMEIFGRAEEGGDPRAEEAVQLFFELLGQVAGNVAISMSTFDGVYIAGGIAKRYPAILANSRFRSGFENKGRHRSLMERIPTRLITHDDPGLLGASYCAQVMSNQITAKF
jgi:glucokinase